VTDVPIFVAVITAGAGLVGALIPQAAVVIRDVRQAERDRRERAAVATREACVALLSTAGELRTLAESVRDYRGEAEGMRARVQEVWSRAEATRWHATNVGMLAPLALAGPAEKVAEAASSLAEVVARSIDPDEGVLIGDPPDATRLAERIAAFRSEAVGYAKG